MRKYRKTVFNLILAVMIAVVNLSIAHGEEVKKAEPVRSQGEFTVSRFVVGTEVKDKEPVGVADKFAAATEKVYCYLEAKNIAKDTDVSFVWIHNQKEMLKTGLALKAGSRWRTYADKTLRGLKGDWKVELRDASGKTVKEVNFKVE